MTRMYLYIETGVRLNADTNFYKVAIGESPAQRKVNAWLESYAIEHGHYFVRWSIDAADFLTKCTESIGPDAKPLHHIVGTALVRALKNGCEDPATFLANQHRHELLMRIDPKYYMYHHLSMLQKQISREASRLYYKPKVVGTNILDDFARRVLHAGTIFA